MSHKVLTYCIVIGIPKNLNVQIFKPFQTLFHMKIDIFFICCQGEDSKPAKNFSFCWFWLGKMHQNGLSYAYLGLEECQIQWCRFWVSMISGSWKIKISGKIFTFCWFWVEKMHQNGLSGAYLVFKAYRIQLPLFQVSMISGSWKIKISGKIFTFCWFWVGKMHQNGLSGAYLVFKAYRFQLPLFQVSMISGSWKIKFFRDK